MNEVLNLLLNKIFKTKKWKKESQLYFNQKKKKKKNEERKKERGLTTKNGSYIRFIQELLSVSNFSFYSFTSQFQISLFLIHFHIQKNPQCLRISCKQSYIYIYIYIFYIYIYAPSFLSLSLQSKLSWRVSTLLSDPPLLIHLYHYLLLLLHSPSRLASSCSSHFSPSPSLASLSFSNGGADSTTPWPVGLRTTMSSPEWPFPGPDPPTRLAPIVSIFSVRVARRRFLITGIGISGSCRIWSQRFDIGSWVLVLGVCFLMGVFWFLDLWWFER